MKKIVKIFFALAIPLMMWSCEDALQTAIDETPVAPVLSSDIQKPVLLIDEKGEPFGTFTYSAADYGFDASVTYTLQVSGDSEFTNAADVTSVNNALAIVPSVGEVNTQLLALELTPAEAAQVHFRVVATVNPKVSKVVSNTESKTVTPYATVFPSIYGMGAALNGWGPWPTNAVELESAVFQKYETVAKFTNGEAFRFFKQLDWNPVSYNYPYFTTVDPLFENANDGDSNLKFIGASGYYKINVDLNTKTVTMEATAEPVLYMTGAAINEWSWNAGKPVKMTYIKPGVFEATLSFKNDTFRFFGQADWGPVSYNYPYFTTVNPSFENGNDGDSNLKYVGGLSPITLQVNLVTKVVSVK